MPPSGSVSGSSSSPFSTSLRTTPSQKYPLGSWPRDATTSAVAGAAASKKQEVEPVSSEPSRRMKSGVVGVVMAAFRSGIGCGAPPGGGSGPGGCRCAYVSAVVRLLRAPGWPDPPARTDPDRRSPHSQALHRSNVAVPKVHWVTYESPPDGRGSRGLGNPMTALVRDDPGSREPRADRSGEGGRLPSWDLGASPSTTRARGPGETTRCRGPCHVRAPAVGAAVVPAGPGRGRPGQGVKSWNFRGRVIPRASISLSLRIGSTRAPSQSFSWPLPASRMWMRTRVW